MLDSEGVLMPDMMVDETVETLIVRVRDDMVIDG